MKFVEAARGVPRTEQVFTMWTLPETMGTPSASSVQGCGLTGISVLADDIFGLGYAGLISVNVASRDSHRFTITADGFAYYESLRARTHELAAAIEEDVSRYLDGETFRRRHGSAHERLIAAQELLWQANPGDDLTTIGHKLREAIQQFATSMVGIHKPADVDTDPAKTTSRLRAVVEMNRTRLGERRGDLLDKLLDYLDAVNGIDQRLEHADQKQNDPATWEDARSAVFQTAIVMFEFDRVLR